MLKKERKNALILNIDFFKDNEKVFRQEKIKGTLNQSKLQFTLEKVFHEIDLNQRTLKRENQEFSFFLDAEKKESTYLLKEQDLLFDIQVDYINYMDDGTKILIEYLLETDDSKNKLIIERIG